MASDRTAFTQPSRGHERRPRQRRRWPRGRRAQLLAALVACAMALLLAGCGSGGKATGAEAMKLNVGQISDSVAFFPLFVAEHEGYFKQEGITLGARPRLGTGAKLAAALQSGSIDIGGGVMTDAFNLYKINDKARVIGALVNAYYVDVIAGPHIPTSLDNASLAQKVQALKGKKIGITGPGSGTEALLTYLFKQQGMDAQSSVTMVNLGSDPTAAIGALKSGRVDALSFFQPIGQQAEATHVGRIFISPARGDISQLNGDVHGALITTTDVMKNKPKAVAAFVRAIAKAEKFIGNNPSKDATLLHQYQSAMDPNTIKAITPVLQKEIPTNPIPTRPAYAKAATFHKQSGLITNPPAYNQIIPVQWLHSAIGNGSGS